MSRKAWKEGSKQLETNENPQTAANRLVGIWSQDVIFVINQLDRLNSDNDFPLGMRCFKVPHCFSKLA